MKPTDMPATLPDTTSRLRWRTESEKPMTDHHRVRRRPRRDAAFICKKCDGPCPQYAGDIFGWTCNTCIAELVVREED